MADKTLKLIGAIVVVVVAVKFGIPLIFKLIGVVFGIVGTLLGLVLTIIPLVIIGWFLYVVFFKNKAHHEQ